MGQLVQIGHPGSMGRRRGRPPPRVWRRRHGDRGYTRTVGWEAFMASRGTAIAVAALAAALWGAAPAGASTTWRAQAVPGPAHSTMGLNDVSCPSPRGCIAVGPADHITAPTPFP